MQDQQSMVELLRADVEIARFNQEFSVIRAPSDGVILQKMAEIHEQVAPGDVIFRLGELGVSTAVVQAGISDRDITHLRVGDTSIITGHSTTDLEFTGKITRIPARADTRSGIYTVEITLDSNSEPQNPRGWRNGMLVRGELIPAATTFYARIPVSALVEADGQDVWIYTPTNDRLATERRRVRPLHITDTTIYVDPSQLEGATSVVTSGAAYLRPGTPVRIMQEVQL
jgi:multidrug efflux pump subunit AcrA (membrane-fusion protein)